MTNPIKLLQTRLDEITVIVNSLPKNSVERRKIEPLRLQYVSSVYQLELLLYNTKKRR
mgnify:CR=1 FL=1|tara:strand:+ start:674 stop:847 length:174 start_codon:yes stop_codon:yes gene_type:complete